MFIEYPLYALHCCIADIAMNKELDFLKHSLFMELPFQCMKLALPSALWTPMPEESCSGFSLSCGIL